VANVLEVTFPWHFRASSALPCCRSRCPSTTIITNLNAGTDHLSDVRLGFRKTPIPMQVNVVGTLMFWLRWQSCWRRSSSSAAMSIDASAPARNSGNGR
jgi:hypothetical protein